MHRAPAQTGTPLARVSYSSGKTRCLPYRKKFSLETKADGCVAESMSDLVEGQGARVGRVSVKCATDLRLGHRPDPPGPNPKASSSSYSSSSSSSSSSSPRFVLTRSRRVNT
ncbi:hypothetical protein E2C01_042346 [Portunus trituberculatus]|uniref:Uncharacterized protein n=1 Tax=Portunus trituberculatus TaxID=210409 RepID=A0A5B7FLK6_PORTR|nr:hypothetical protein [Portunus trituberculatus]